MDVILKMSRNSLVTGFCSHTRIVFSDLRDLHHDHALLRTICQSMGDELNFCRALRSAYSFHLGQLLGNRGLTRAAFRGLQGFG